MIQDCPNVSDVILASPHILLHFPKLLQYVLERYVKSSQHHYISHCSMVTVQLAPLCVLYEAYPVSNVPQYVTFVLIENFALAEFSFCSRANIQQMVLELVSQMLFRG